jgi:mono/diheme cytochrome c family protein
MRLLLVTGVAFLLFACGGPSAGAKSPGPATLDDQVAMGQKEFSEHCASCHGGDGQGGDKAPALVGPKGLGDYKNAKQAFAYAKEHMPPDKPGSLSDDEYWSVVAFLVKKNDLPITAPLTPGNAESVTWSR